MTITFLELNNEILYESYKEIYITCLSDGYPLPYLISSKEIPSKYFFTDEEYNRLFKKVSVKKEKLLEDAYFKRRQKEISIHKSTKSNNKRQEKYINYYNTELKDFIKKYPKYKNILKTK